MASETKYLVWDRNGGFMGLHRESAAFYKPKGYTLVRESDALALAKVAPHSGSSNDTYYAISQLVNRFGATHDLTVTQAMVLSNFTKWAGKQHNT